MTADWSRSLSAGGGRGLPGLAGAAEAAEPASLGRADEGAACDRRGEEEEGTSINKVHFEGTLLLIDVLCARYESNFKQEENLPNVRQAHIRTRF